MRQLWETIKQYCRKNKNTVYILIAATLFSYMAMSVITQKIEGEIKEIPYTEFIGLCNDKKVDTVYYDKASEYMTVTLFNEETKEMPKKEREEYKYEAKDKRKVLYPSYDEFRKDMLEKDVNLSITQESTWIDVLSLVGTLIFPILWMVILFRMIRSQTKGLDKNTVIQQSDIKFSNVIGHDEIIDDIKFIAELIKNPGMSDEVGAKVPKGILLEGPPGTGKTLIAKAIAGEAGVPFISMSGSDFKELYVGMGAKRVRELFKIARSNSPCIIFIDEIDSVGGKRNGVGTNSEDNQTINALLKEMDGFTGREGIFIMAATNHADHLDSALVRSGRFDRKITINPPNDWRVRKMLFEYYLNNYKVSDDIDIDMLSKTVVGFTGADIAMVCNEAGIIAVMKKKPCIDTNCIEEAIDKKIFSGNRKKDDKTHKKDKEIIAYHESGHAVMNYLLGHEIARASIIGTTSGVGGVVFGQDSESFFMTDKEMEEDIMVAYAGRASEEIKYDAVTTGASNDITQATKMIVSYIERYGFDKDFGMLDMQVLEEKRLVEGSDMTNRISEMSKRLYKETHHILSGNYDKVETLARELLEKETLSGEEIKKLLSV